MGTSDERRAIIFQSPWGWMGISETDKGLDGIALPKKSKRAVEIALRDQSTKPFVNKATARLKAAQQQLIEYLEGVRQGFDLPLDLSNGTAFQRKVWRTLLQVPYAKLRSYQWVAVRVGGSQYARAVGNAVGANPLPIMVPCHRIVAQNATLGGFSGGLPTKRKLLTLEGSLAQLQCGRT